MMYIFFVCIPEHLSERRCRGCGVKLYGIRYREYSGMVGKVKWERCEWYKVDHEKKEANNQSARTNPLEQRSSV